MIDCKPVLHKDWWAKNIKNISDICNVNGSIMTREQIQDTYEINVDLMKYNSIIAAVPNKWRQTIKQHAVHYKSDDIYVSLHGAKKTFCMSNVKIFIITLLQK